MNKAIILLVTFLFAIIALVSAASIEVSKFKISIDSKGKDESSASSFTPIYPTKLTEVVNVKSNQLITVTAELKDSESKKVIHPHQVFLRFVHDQSGTESIFVLPQDKSNHKITIDLKKASGDVFDYRSGTYTVQFIAGDASEIKPVLWNVATFSLTLPEQPPLNLAAKRVVEEAKLYSKLPEIKHQFRVPEKRAPRVVSTVFTLLVIAPLLFLFSGFIGLKVNLSNIPKGTGFLYNVGFQAIIFLLLLTIFVYWVKITIFQAFAYLTILGIAGMVVGSKALFALNESKKEKQD